MWYTSHIACVLAAIIVYLNSLEGDFVHDDIFAIKNNPDVTGDRQWYKGFYRDFWGRNITDDTSHKSYRPLTILTFRINYKLGDGSAYGFHVVNIALHALMTFLFMHVCLHIAGVTLNCATVAGFIFAVHPIHTEAVSSIVGRADLLAGVIFLLSFIFYTKSLGMPQVFYDKYCTTRKALLFLLSLFLGAACMLCKETGITVFGVNILYDICFCCKGKILKAINSKTVDRSGLSVIKRLLTILVVVSILIVFRLWIMGKKMPIFTEADNPASFSSSLLTRVLTYNYIYALNAWILLIPVTLSYDWQGGSIPTVDSWWDIRNIATLFFIISLTTILMKSFMLYRNNQRDISPMIALFLMVVPFLPASNLFFRVGFVLAERILYIPSTGYCILVSYGLTRLQDHFQHLRYHFTLGFVMLLLMFSLKTWRQNEVWQSRESLFRAGLNTLPNNAKIHYNFANLMKDKGETKAAIHHYRKTIELWPNYASSHNNLGTLLDNKTEAEFHFRKALQLLPTHFGAYINLGNLLHQRGDLDGAVEILQKAVQINKNHAGIFLMLGNILSKGGRLDEAEIHYLAAISKKPDFADAYNNYGVYLENKGNFNKAISFFKKAISCNSSHVTAMINAAKGLQQLKRWDEAEQMLERALSIKRDASVLDHLGILYLKQQNNEKALAVFEKIQQQWPNNPKMLMHYVHALVVANQLVKAEEILLKLVNTPVSIQARRSLASIYGLQRRYQDAITHLNIAIENTNSQDLLAELYFERGDQMRDLKLYTAAALSYNKGLALKPDKAAVHLNLGVILHLNDNLELARLHYNTALRLDPSNKLVKENLRKLEEREKDKKNDHT